MKISQLFETSYGFLIPPKEDISGAMKELGFNDGVKIYCEGTKQLPVKRNRKGEIVINSQIGGYIRSIIIDFGPNRSLGQKFDIAKNCYSFDIYGEYAEHFDSFGLFKSDGTRVDILSVNCRVNFKNLADSGFITTEIRFETEPDTMGLLSAYKIINPKCLEWNRPLFTLHPKMDKQKYLPLMGILQEMLEGKLDEFEAQDKMIELGFKGAAKL